MDTWLLIRAEWIKSRREEVGYTQEELGRLVGCIQQTISAMEHGRIEPSQKLLRQIHRVLREVNVDAL